MDEGAEEKRAQTDAGTTEFKHDDSTETADDAAESDPAGATEEEPTGCKYDELINIGADVDASGAGAPAEAEAPNTILAVSVQAIGFTASTNSAPTVCATSAPKGIRPGCRRDSWPQARGFRQFLLRGLDQVRREWAMLCTAHNLLKLAQARP